MTKNLPTLQNLAADLEAGRTTSRKLVEDALARIDDPKGEGSRTFTAVYHTKARAAADAQDALRKAGYVASVIAGIPVSIKDLFDVKGETTRSGSKALDDAAPATADAAIVARLRNAGAVVMGRTNMTEFAFSGLGINPHYGTPGNPYDRKRIPGGSSSGAAVAVADGMSAFSIGTDTGGSVRIPAALCGIYGFKPSQQRVPRDGCLPLSTTLDSIGPLAASVACCFIGDAVMAGEDTTLPQAATPRSLTLGVPQTLVLDELDPVVASGFQRAREALAKGGVTLVDLPVPELAEIPKLNAVGGFSPPEALAWHGDLLTRRGSQYDPIVRTRIERGRTMSAVDYVKLIEGRQKVIAQFKARIAGLDGLLMPTVAITAPEISTFDSLELETYLRYNQAILRNCALINFLNGCALTLPVIGKGALPMGVSIAGANGTDKRILAIGLGLEKMLAELR